MFPDLPLQQALEPGHKSGAIASPSHLGDLSAALCSLLRICLSLVLTFQFLRGHGTVSLLISGLQGAGEIQETERDTRVVSAAYLVCHLVWPEQNLLELGTWTRGDWLGLGYSGSEEGDGVGAAKLYLLS